MRCDERTRERGETLWCILFGLVYLYFIDVDADADADELMMCFFFSYLYDFLLYDLWST